MEQTKYVIKINDAFYFFMDDYLCSYIPVFDRIEDAEYASSNLGDIGEVKIEKITVR